MYTSARARPPIHSGLALICWSLGLYLSLAPISAPADELPLADVAGIWYSPADSVMLNQAATELNNGLLLLTGQRLPILQEAPTADQVAIVLGRDAALQVGLLQAGQISASAPGGYAVHGDERGVAIAGARPFDTRLGVRAYLEWLGLTDYGDGSAGTRRVRYIARTDLNALPLVSRVSRPDMPMRNYFNRPDQALPNQALMALNPELKGKTQMWIDHSAGFLLPKALYYDEHPEYYAMLADGSRIAKSAFTDARTPLCLSNPAVTRISIERALQWLALQPERTIVPITYGDTGLWCQCQPCLALDEKPGEYAARLLHWVNPVARAIGAEYPEHVVFTFAYAGTDLAPSGIKPEPNVRMVLSSAMDQPWIAHLIKTDTVHPKLMAKIQGWTAHAPGQIWVCEYTGGKYIPAMADQQAAKLRFYRDLGVDGIMYSFGSPDNLKALWSYLYGHLMWDLDADEMALTREFARHYYGPAAPAMVRYLELAHEQHAATLASITAETLVDARRPPDFYTHDFVTAALAAFDDASAAADPGLPADVPAKDLSPEQRRQLALLAEIRREAALFLTDAMRHPGSGPFDAAAADRLRLLLERRLANAGDKPAARVDAARELNRIGIIAEQEQPGTQAYIRQWLAQQAIELPGGRLIQNGIVLDAETFMFGFGPISYSGGHKGPPCPAKMATGIYVAGNSMNRSDRMTAEFELPAVPPDARASISLHGQDSDDKDMPPADIAVTLNGKEIYRGPTTAVKWNWSWHAIDIPPGLLKTGNNRLTIANVSDPESVSYWHQRWFMLADATITFLQP